MTGARPGRQLIVNADDLGQNDGINRGIIEAFTKGIVTSASLMVRWPHAAKAVRMARQAGLDAIGLHTDLGEWSFEDEQWEPIYEVVDVADPAAIAAEVSRQLDAFHGLVGRPPSHLDSHQHVHRREPVASILASEATRLGVPLREHGPVAHIGGFYGQDVDGSPLRDVLTVPYLLGLIADLPPGVSELGCHPGLPEYPPTMYRAERARELAILCDPELAAGIERLGVRLVSFADVADLGQSEFGDGHRGEGE